MSAEPDVIIGSHPEFGVAAVNRRSAEVHVALQDLGFQVIPGQQMWALQDADRDQIVRVRSVVTRLRSAGFHVSADHIYDPPDPS
ncbi:hypothetical protein [Streptomyces sp. NPDC098781]|uniref:hypothetical protein n=1 Tax=Streptomyces sp. NPDC098781 TaxID=3366097 RepID=UPI0038059B3D